MNETIHKSFIIILISLIVGNVNPYKVAGAVYFGPTLVYQRAASFNLNKGASDNNLNKSFVLFRHGVDENFKRSGRYLLLQNFNFIMVTENGFSSYTGYLSFLAINKQTSALNQGVYTSILLRAPPFIL